MLPYNFGAQLVTLQQQARQFNNFFPDLLVFVVQGSQNYAHGEELLIETTPILISTKTLLLKCSALPFVISSIRNCILAHRLMNSEYILQLHLALGTASVYPIYLYILCIKIYMWCAHMYSVKEKTISCEYLEHVSSSIQTASWYWGLESSPSAP